MLAVSSTLGLRCQGLSPALLQLQVTIHETSCLISSGQLSVMSHTCPLTMREGVMVNHGLCLSDMPIESSILGRFTIFVNA